MNIEVKIAFMFFFLLGLTGFLWSCVTCIFRFIEKWYEFNLIGKIIIILALIIKNKVLLFKTFVGIVSLFEISSRILISTFSHKLSTPRESGSEKLIYG